MSVILFIILCFLSLVATFFILVSFSRFFSAEKEKKQSLGRGLEEDNARALLKNKNLKQGNKKLSEKVEQIQNLYEITRGMGSALELESTFEEFSKKFAEMFSFRQASLILLEDKEVKVEIKRVMVIPGRGDAGKDVKKDAVSPANKNLVELFIKTQKGPFFIADTTQSLLARRISLPQAVKSFAAIPLVMDKKIMAIITMEDMQEEDFERLSVVAAQLALEIRKSRLYEEVQRLSIIDGLTETYLRRHFLERLNEELERSRHHKLPASFLMIDIDHFKKCNDQYGHLVGDVVLKDVAAVLKKGVREIDLVGRYGGEEFCLLLCDTHQEGGKLVAERLRSLVEEHQFKAYDEIGKVTISLGLATFPDNAEDAETLIDKADQALYRAKETGRNKVCITPKN